MRWCWIVLTASSAPVDDPAHLDVDLLLAERRQILEAFRDPHRSPYAAVERRDSRYLSQLAAYYDKLAAEAPPQAGKDIRLIVPAYQRLASSIANGNVQSLGKIEQQLTTLLTSGAAANAFKQLIAYVTAKCG